MNRESFLRNSAVLSTGLGLIGWLPASRALGNSDRTRITILHTNDTHSRIEPFPDSHPQFSGMGGVARRAALIKQLRAENPDSLLLDAGDAFQGTPYYNKFKGALDLEVMSKMGYDAMTIGNHEFDNGVSGFEKVMDKARFPFVSSNYDYGTTRMGLRMQRFLLRQVGGVKIGIFGIGVAFDRLVLPHLHRGVRYLDPLEVSADMVSLLKGYHGCDMVICLSHIGYRHRDNHRVSDRMVADQVDGIDVIIGGHTHTFLNEPEQFEKRNGSRTWITQVGFSGILLGKMDFYFDRERNISGVTHHHYPVSERETVLADAQFLPETNYFTEL
ncbi:MAG: metallophosphatase [Balneolales bacterium]